MLSFKSAVVYCPGPGDEKFCDNFYFNSKVITPAMSENKVRLTQKTARGGRQMFALATGIYSPSTGSSSVNAVFGKLKKYHAFFLKNTDTNVERLIKNYFADAALDVSQTIESDDDIYTKVSCALLCTDDEKITVANVGCVKIFSIKDGNVRELTVEHTQAMKMVSMGVVPMAKLKGHPQRKKLVRYLGINREASVPDIETLTAAEGEVFVILGTSFADLIDRNTLLEAAKLDEPGDIATSILNSCVDTNVGDFSAIVVKCVGEGAEETETVDGDAADDVAQRRGKSGADLADEAAAIAAAEKAARAAAEERTKAEAEKAASAENERMAREQ
ncbi:MAG: hypothetical protein J5921_01685, partial [Clostridia bacterium]|nr:hypothetical protein [Clostridia bacterium]